VHVSPSESLNETIAPTQASFMCFVGVSWFSSDNQLTFCERVMRVSVLLGHFFTDLVLGFATGVLCFAFKDRRGAEYFAFTVLPSRWLQRELLEY